jgi:hypothetical protein
LDAADGREALELIEHDMPAIILTDIIMPNLNGLPERNGGSGGGELADIGMDWIIAAKRYLNLSITIGGSAVQCGIAAFNKVYPNIKVEHVKFTNTDEGNVKIDMSLLAGQNIDVFFNFGINRVIPRIQKGLLQDLSPATSLIWKPLSVKWYRPMQ